MSWARGVDNNGREVGYAVEAICDLDGCDKVIDRGIAFLCGGAEAVGNAGMDDEPYCGGFFCSKHLFFIHAPDRDGGDGMMVCPACHERAICPDCKGEAHDADGEPCETCDSFGRVARRIAV